MSLACPSYPVRKHARVQVVVAKEPEICKQIALQMWDTAGKERFSSAESTKGLLTSRLGDSFFSHADAAILIYDATSSKSFLQLIKWYSELLDRVKKVNLKEKTSQ